MHKVYTLIEDEEDYPTPVTDSAGHDDVFVGRIREDISHMSGINYMGCWRQYP